MKFLLRLYPRAWRQRYEDEVSAYLDEARPPAFRTALDLIAGAIDARINPAISPGMTTEGDARMLIDSCRCDTLDVPVRDALKSAAWMIGLSLLMAGAGIYLDRMFGEHVAVQALLYSAFFIAFTVAARYTYLRPYSPRVRNTIVLFAVPMWYLFFLVVAIVGERI